MVTRKKSAKSKSTNAAPEGAEDTNAAPEGAEDTNAAPEGAEDTNAAPVDPIVKLQVQRDDAEALLKECLGAVASAAASGDEEGVLSASTEIAQHRKRIDSFTKEIAETGFAQRLEERVRAFLQEIGEADIPQGDVRLQIVIDERKLVGVAAVRAIPSGKSGKRKSSGTVAKAALRSQARDPRLPPAGLCLPSLGGEGRGPCMVAYTETAQVFVTGPCADGTVLKEEPFSSTSQAGKHVTGSPVNGYVWAQLGSKGHAWSGEQVDRKNQPIG